MREGSENDTTQLTAIKAKTDNLTAHPADQATLDGYWTYLWSVLSSLPLITVALCNEAANAGNVNFLPAGSTPLYIRSLVVMGNGVRPRT